MQSSTSYQTKEIQNIEQENIAFFDRRMFRVSYPFSVAVGTPVVIKFASAVNFVLRSQILSVTANGLTYEAVVGGAESGSFSTPIQTWGVNRMTESDAPAYVSQVTLNTGGAVTGGVVAETIAIAASNQTPNTTDTIAAKRGLPAGNYFLRMTASGGTATGTLSLLWEERP